MSRCKCPKSDVKQVEQCSPYFESITSRMEERRCDLIGRQKYLRDKITTMERSIPALMAYNMWMAKDKCVDAPYCKVREIMKKFAPHPDQTERLLETLKKTVKELNGETSELHEKIIQADVKLEETGMELESLELQNKEMNDTLNNLEKEVKSYISPSLHSIHSQDLICLSKVRQLAAEELCLKNCIKELENKETLFKEHMDRLLTSKEYQSVCGRRKMISCLQNLDCSGTRIPCVPKKCLWQKPSGQRPKKTLGGADSNVAQADAMVSASEPKIKSKQDQGVMSESALEKTEKKTSWVPNWWKSNEEVPPSTNEETVPPSVNEAENEKSSVIEVSTQSPGSEKELTEKKTVETVDKPSKPWKTSSCKPCGHAVCPPDTPADRKGRKKRLCAGKLMSPCDFTCNKFIKALSKCADPSLIRAFCQLPCATTDHGTRSMCKPFMSPCKLENACEICPSSLCKDFLRPKGNCRCNCRGKCARGLSDTECNCSDVLLEPEEQYQPKGSKQLKDSLAQESNSEDEYCECCSCGCEDSDMSLCQCN